MLIRVNKVDLTETGMLEFINLDEKGDIVAVAAFVASAMTLVGDNDDEVLALTYGNFQPAPNLRYMNFVLLLSPIDGAPVVEQGQAEPAQLPITP